MMTIVAASFFVVISIIVAPVYFWVKTSCYAQARVMEKQASFGLFQDCMIKVGNEWVPLSNYRKFD